MSSQNPKIAISKSLVEGFCKSNHIVKLALFGSVLSDYFSESSDVDILVEFDPEHVPGLFSLVDMQEQLSQNIGRKVDLRTPEDISKYFRKEALEKSYLLYGQEGFKLV